MVVKLQADIYNEIRRRFEGKTNANFRPSDWIDGAELIPAVDYDRDFDFKGCKSVTFLEDSRNPQEDLGSSVILAYFNVSGHIRLPAGVRVMVNSGYAKWETGSESSDDLRAPPPRLAGGLSRANTMAEGDTYPRRGISRVDSSQVGGYSRRSTLPSPPRNAATFNRPVGSSRDSYVSARSGGDDWTARSQAMSEDNCSIAPSESISSVGSRGGRTVYY